MDFTDIIKRIDKEVSFDDLKLMRVGEEYIIYNPVTKYYRIDKIGRNDITHNKHRCSNLKFYSVKCL